VKKTPRRIAVSMEVRRHSVRRGILIPARVLERCFPAPLLWRLQRLSGSSVASSKMEQADSSSALLAPTSKVNLRNNRGSP
jgi:hypothetical protein